jgi:hypothetical protein
MGHEAFRSEQEPVGARLILRHFDLLIVLVEF